MIITYRNSDGEVSVYRDTYDRVNDNPIIKITDAQETFDIAKHIQCLLESMQVQNSFIEE